jgi:hypothetical protein
MEVFMNRNIIVSLLFLTLSLAELGAMKPITGKASTAKDNWGFDIAQREIHPKILNYATKRRVPGGLAKKLNTLFEDREVVKSFDALFGLRWDPETDLEKAPENILARMVLHS